MVLLETINLCQRCGERDVLKNINLQIERGEVFALIGPTGAGKTTLLRLIDLIDDPTSGKIIFDGVEAASSPRLRLEMRRRMAFVLQKPVVFNTSVYDNVACGLRWRGVERSDICHKVGDILDLVGLAADRDRNARTLSGGEIQRVAIARAIAVAPEVLLLDEPTANLDPISAARVEKLITGIIRRYDTTVLMATHDMAQGQRLADRIGVLVGGEMRQTGSAAEIFTSPTSWEVAEFVGMENLLDGMVASSEGGVISVNIGGGVVEAIFDCAVGEKVVLGIRPEDVILALSPLSSSARNSFAGEVEWLISEGPLSKVKLDCGFPLVALVTRRSAAELGLEMGKQVHVTFKATGVHVIKRN